MKPDVIMSGDIRAVTFDFFDTLIRHRKGHGRGRSLSDYLLGSGYASPPQWHDGALYRVFENHAAEYSPKLADDERHRYLLRLASRVFDELGHDPGSGQVSRHAEAIWEILGPAAFELYPDAVATLEYLRSRGLPLAVISNWHCGVEHFVSELGLLPYFDHVIGSADCGFAKPDARIFARASALLDVPPSQILHVGDDFEADYRGGRAAGFRTALVQRGSRRHPEADEVIGSLPEVRLLLA